jgi:signal transduction histidine kinase/PAS domain-containing protein
VIVVLPLIAALLAGLTILLALRRRGTGRSSLAALGAALLVWTLGQVLEQRLEPWPAPRFWEQVKFLGIVATPLGWLHFALVYAGSASWLTLRRLALLALVPAITTVLIWTNGAHELFWRGGNTIADTGPWFWVHTAFSYAALLAGTVILVWQALRTSGVHRLQAIALLASTLTPWAINGVFLAGLVAFPVDPTPIALSLSTFLLALTILRYRLLDIVPVARDLVVESLGDAVLVLDNQGRVADANAAARRLLGVPAAPVGQASDALLAPWLTLLPLDANGDEPEVQTVSRSGRIYEVQVRPLLQRGQRLGTVVAWHDITVRVTAEARERALAQLAQRQARDLDLIDQVRVAILEEHSPEALCASVVEWIAGSFGYRLAALYLVENHDLVLKHQVGYAHALTRQSVQRGVLGQVARTGDAALVTDARQHPDFVFVDPAVVSEVAVPLHDGEQIVGVLSVESTGEPQLGEDDLRLLLILGQSVSSVLARARAEAALRAAHESLAQRVAELDAFAHTVAHNIKTPLTAIVVSCDLLGIEGVEISSEDTRGFCQIIRDNSMHLNSIVDALLLLASTTTSHSVPQHLMNMGTIVAALPRRLQTMISSHGATIELPPRWPLAVGYGPWVEEIWANYVSNAIKYGGPSPRVVLGADPPVDGVVRFWVRDEGPGLNAEEQARLFTPFTRLHLGKAQGHGLGLSIVQRIASRLSGTVGVESKPGAGSMFYFTLPAAAADNHRSSDEVKPQQESVPMREVDPTSHFAGTVTRSGIRGAYDIA